MRLENYLKKLRQTPDILLESELGISDNWEIYLHADFDFILNRFMNNSLYSFSGRIDESYKFNYIPGIVNLKVSNFFSHDINYMLNGSEIQKQPYIKEMSKYNMMVCLFPHQEKQILDISSKRALANVAEEILTFTLHENIPVCLPYSVGTKYLDEDFLISDYSRIVYYPDFQPKKE